MVTVGEFSHEIFNASYKLRTDDKTALTETNGRFLHPEYREKIFSTLVGS
jgi:hypothetical protein